MARLLPFILMGALLFLAISVSAEDEVAKEVAENENINKLAEASADPGRRKGGGGNGKRGGGKDGGRVKKKKKRRREKNRGNGGKQGEGKKGGKKNTKKGRRTRKNRAKSKNGNKKKDKKKNNQDEKKKNQDKTKTTRTGGPVCRTNDDSCLVNLVKVFKYVGGTVTNFNQKKARVDNWAKLVGKKLAKADSFATTTATLLAALGGNASAPVCGSSGRNFAKSTSTEAIATYNLLAACSASITTACSIPADTYNSTQLEECSATFAAISDKNKECCDDTVNADGAAKCTCFTAANDLVNAAKAGPCNQAGKDANNAMKAVKTACLTAFAACKSAEDASIGLVNICLGGTDPNAG